MKDSHVTAGLYIATAIAGVIAAVVLVKKYGGTVAKVASAVNPVNPNNVVNRAANSVFQSATGNNVDSIGTWLYGVLNKDDAGKIATAPSVVAPRQVIKLGDYETATDLADAEARQAPLSVDLGEYADTIANDDAYLGALMNGFSFGNTAPAFISYSAAFPTKRFSQ